MAGQKDTGRVMVWMDNPMLRLAGLAPDPHSGGRVVCLQDLEAGLRARGLTLSEATRRLKEPAGARGAAAARPEGTLAGGGPIMAKGRHGIL